jgi:hypothetical protein
LTGYLGDAQAAASIGDLQGEAQQLDTYLASVKAARGTTLPAVQADALTQIARTLLAVTR